MKKRSAWQPAPPQITVEQLRACRIADLTEGRETEGVLIDAQQTPAVIQRPVLSGSVLRDLHVPRSRWADLRLADCRIERCDFSNAHMPGARWRNVEIHTCALTGIDLSDADITDAVFHSCKLDLGSMFNTQFRRCVFQNCRMTECDFEGANLRQVALRGCDLRAVRLGNATLQELDLRESLIDGLQINPATLRHVRISAAQAAALITLLGVEVD